jgi:hypothetical protein
MRTGSGTSKPSAAAFFRRPAGSADEIDRYMENSSLPEAKALRPGRTPPR